MKTAIEVIKETCKRHGVRLPEPSTIYNDAPITKRRKLGRAELFRVRALESLEAQRVENVREVKSIITSKKDQGDFERVKKLREEIKEINKQFYTDMKVIRSLSLIALREDVRAS
jgi:hypothetical protein